MESNKLTYKKNEPFMVTLKDMMPKEFDGEYGKSYMYNIINNEKEGFFASPTLKSLIDAAGVQGGQEFTLELAQVQFDDGMKSFWKLNGKTKNQWINDQALNASVQKFDNQVNTDPKPESVNTGDDKLKELEFRIEKLEQKLTKQNAEKSELPF